MSGAGIRTKDIRAALLVEDPNLKTTARDIYNQKQKFRREALNGDTAVEAFMKELKEDDVFHKVKADGMGRITHLHIVPKASLSVAREFSANLVFLLDCTYKTNR